MVTINELVDITALIAGKKLIKKHNLTAPVGVRGRNSDNEKIRKTLNWDYSVSLEKGISQTYTWISNEISKM
jgi:nucleoside-diphosphate-sugar epimerase